MDDQFETAAGILGPPGRLLSASKSSYSQRYPDNIVAYNANVCTDKEKIWFGDIDCTHDVEKLKELATTLQTKIYVLREMDARFENESKPLIKKAVFACGPQ